MNADEIYLVRGSDHRIHLVQGRAGGRRHVLFTCDMNLATIQTTYRDTLKEPRDVHQDPFVRALQVVQLPETQQEVYDLPYEIVGGYVTLWCLTEERFREEEGLFTQRPSPARLRAKWWYVVAVREDDAYSATLTLQGLMRGGLARLLNEDPMEYARAWNTVPGYAAGLIKPSRVVPQYDQLRFRLEEEPEEKPLPLSVIHDAARMARHREE